LGGRYRQRIVSADSFKTWYRSIPITNCSKIVQKLKAELPEGK